jgi:NADPH:quinone reductase-like Zn-dependent oxidoreductase
MSKGIVLPGFGEPDVLRWQDVADPWPAPGEVLIAVRAAGVGPTDVAIRAGRLAQAFPGVAEGTVLGFEAAAVVQAVGEGVTDAKAGDEVLALLPHLGGYAELVTTTVWFPKPASVSWADAAALPASGEAAVGVLREVGAREGETIVVLGAGGSVGQLVLQLARAWGIRAVGAASEGDAELVRALGGEPVVYGDGVFDRVRDVAPTVHAVIDAAGHGGVAEAVAATGDPSRVVTLVDAPGAAAAGAKMSEPGPDRAPDALAIAVPLLAAGDLVLKRQTELPITDAAEAHRRLEGGLTHDKLVLIVG